jgi:hypothetical protein
MAVPLSSLLYAGLRTAGITTRPGRGPSSDQFADAFAIYNRMVGGWSNSEIDTFQLAITPFTLSASQQAYTIGPGGAGPYWINAARPSKIVRANLFISGSPTTVRRPIDVLEPEQWMEKRVQQVNGPPLQLYNDRGSPISTLMFWPIPDKSYQGEIYSWNAVPAAVALSDQVALPPGYEEAIVFNLARRIAAQFPTQTKISPLALELAQSSLNAIQARNTRSPRAINDAARLGRPGRRPDFNWITGSK